MQPRPKTVQTTAAALAAGLCLCLAVALGGPGPAAGAEPGGGLAISVNVLGYDVPVFRFKKSRLGRTYFLDHGGREWSFGPADKRRFLGEFMVYAKSAKFLDPEIEERYDLLAQYAPGKTPHPATLVLSYLEEELAQGRGWSSVLDDALLFAAEPLFLDRSDYLAFVTRAADQARRPLKDLNLVRRIEKSVPKGPARTRVLGLSYAVAGSDYRERAFPYLMTPAETFPAIPDRLFLEVLYEVALPRYKSLLRSSWDRAAAFKAGLFARVREARPRFADAFQKNFSEAAACNEKVALTKRAFDRGDYQTCHEYLNQVLADCSIRQEIGQDLSETFLNLGRVLLSQGQNEVAGELFGLAVKYSPASAKVEGRIVRIVKDQIQTDLRGGELDHAAATLDFALHFTEKCDLAGLTWKHLSLAIPRLVADGQTRQAERLFEQRLAVVDSCLGKPDLFEKYLFLADQFRRSGFEEEWLKYAKKALSFRGDPALSARLVRTYRRRAETLASAENFILAAHALEEAADIADAATKKALEEERIGLVVTHCRRLVAKKRFESAEWLLAQLPGTHPKVRSALKELAIAWGKDAIAKGECRTAAEKLRAYRELDPAVRRLMDEATACTSIFDKLF
ncbi:hypothetical protein G3N55_00620 [Dissulfurirhabdus thermomarina]|uniref:Uncharacterized protein n=1 Tax=Dissulfurirhabdus thermomarina TaxID=1765737 RepID=A0A6N9TNM7_DISTH|nr:hypothetical protein [Dissulfurirhabdus thermomarina]NDY41354.1 hypothetical protein [Dissulfurirhabdus thermomarina]NMX23263.1 hypothetical protein [Dissulfurirhabdus thermomarina]